MPTETTNPRPVVHVALDEGDFCTLISGEVVEKRGVRIILSDIGYGVMVKRLSEAMMKSASATQSAERGESAENA
jgi:hypothetical protein